MKKWKLLPHMAVKGIVANGIVYYPYIAAVIFAVFTHFVFSSILQNDLMEILPYKAYAWIILEIGKGLLEWILFFFLLYANSFVIKRRKKEIGLYTLLGLEKKHIGMMLFLESCIVYAITMAGGILLGVVLSKLLFLLLLRLSNVPLDVDFVFKMKAFMETLIYFGIVFLLLFLSQLWEVGKSRPAELMSGSRKGEKEPRLLVLWSVIGTAALIFGYRASIGAQADSMILINFALAVLLVVIGTYLLFTSGSVFFLKLLRRNKKLYYKAKNFITISGMYYRMKKSAAGLVNICIFSTMVIITLICTVSAWLGLDGVTHYICPYDLEIELDEGKMTAEQFRMKLEELTEKYGLTVQRADVFDAISLSCSRDGSSFERKKEEDEKNCDVIIMTLADYEELSGEKEILTGQEVLIHAEGADYGEETFTFMGIDGTVKREVSELFPYPKAEENRNGRYIIIARDDAARDAYVRAWAEVNGVEDMEAFLQSGRRIAGIVLEGEDAAKTSYIEELSEWGWMQDGIRNEKNGLEQRGELCSMYGGLLFIGVIFGTDFFLCLLIIMYYKQISEGYEDMQSYAIMQKVGMSGDEIRSTVHKQILFVFGLPLAGALVHTLAGMFMVKQLMVMIGFFDTGLMIECAVGVSVVFMLIYVISYWRTARTYYRIVNRTAA
ncbi:MAG: FtsX-like permease family protein [Lachnospiraceae bacterium]|nr:FtsX-like permease family protein [Lachnospiraceae bacterium]